ncbi:Demethylmenaquinone methyltransferase [Hypsizygus marmoreus]|uniref:Demethylmenaquinone methyltransferase n=1 Tax=Hypsizygus marmoreus TaxID=39966 RepID=A0A369K3C4_HYPMA|nr:Demethylmenaquinone methyltransferase [Hypsizygus marmoreus]
MVTNDAPIEKNVEAELMNAKVFRRMPGDVPYPVQHTTTMSTFDTWDNMFIRGSLQNLTVHQFETPPAVVLDLGCGNGYWAIEAAKEWKTSTIVGYDLRKAQPNLFKFEQYRDIAHRVKWVHGNLLDGLPFSSSQFDLVRIVNIGLGVPEDEWQFVLQEVARVMKSGAVIELIEEDPIFPCAQPPVPSPPWPLRSSRARPSPISVDLPPFDPSPSSALSSKSSATLMSDPWSAVLDERFDLTPAKPKSTRSSKSASPNIKSPSFSHSPTVVHHPPPPPRISIADSDKTPDPRDHSKLKAAWDAMLASRFLATSLLSVLPFYLSSTFVDVQSFPPLKVRLPPNSGRENSPPLPGLRRSGDSGIAESVYQDSVYSKVTCKSDGASSSSGDTICSASSCWPTMHLAKAVSTITGCKDAIWEEYQEIYGGDATPLVILPLAIRTNRPDGVIAERSKTSVREAFDAEWASWQNDMADRISMRSSIIGQFGWSEPSGDRPDWRVWRSTVAKAQLSDATSPWSEIPSWPGLKTEVDLCRSTRAWVAWKR